MNRLWWILSFICWCIIPYATELALIRVGFEPLFYVSFLLALESLSTEFLFPTYTSMVYAFAVVWVSIYYGFYLRFHKQ